MIKQIYIVNILTVKKIQQCFLQNYLRLTKMIEFVREHICYHIVSKSTIGENKLLGPVRYIQIQLKAVELTQGSDKDAYDMSKNIL